MISGVQTYSILFSSFDTAKGIQTKKEGFKDVFFKALY